MKHVKDLPDLGFVVFAEPSEYYVSFKIYEMPASEPQVYKGEGGEIVESIDEAWVYAHGDVKWDGCSNWHFDEQDHCMLHGCTRQHLVNLGLVLAACWDWASELCPKWDSTIAD